MSAYDILGSRYAHGVGHEIGVERQIQHHDGTVDAAVCTDENEFDESFHPR